MIAMQPKKEAMRAIKMVSFIIPAWNEERMLGQTLPVLERAARALTMRHETIVVDDASTDRTGRVAREHGCSWSIFARWPPPAMPGLK
jgi:glycosyltransferase involved in cell wall biosynthesis